MNAEQKRLQERDKNQAPWHRWGPYLSERQWGGVREDYSADGDAWNYFPHDLARSRAYRWGEDGMGGFCDENAEVCFALAFWNGQDPILKERLFGLSNSEGNHGEDVKEYYFYTDNTPTHSYMRWVYKYPQRAYPYDELVRVNGQRNRLQPEYELLDTGIFNDDRYFDITAEYAKASPEDICLRLHIANRGPETAAIDVLPTLWLRNTWRWVGAHPPGQLTKTGDGIIELNHHTFGRCWLYCDHSGGRAPELLFTDNETNLQRVFSVANETPYVKDGFHRYLVHGEHAAVNPRATGTKAAAHYSLRVAAGKTATLQLRFTDHQSQTPFDSTFVQLFGQRQREADAFYQALTPDLNDKEVRTIQRQALAALLWTKQYYEYDVERWLQGDPAEPPPPAERLHGRNSAWRAFKAKNVISMPDKWEFPWFASWDWAFHCVVFSLIDPTFAKSQLQLPFSPTYLNPNGQVPAYEWGFEQVNPPIQAWATLKVYGNDKRTTGKGDQPFLKTMFQGVERNFDWWQSCEDSQCRGLYAGGFLGLDDIAVFNRNLALPTGGHLQQSDGTAWAAMFALALVEIALELACEDKTYVPKALHYLEKFLEIAKAMNYIGKDGHLALWDEQDGFYFSALVFPDGREELLKVYSLVGLAPLFATQTVEPQVQELVPEFFEGLESLRQRRPDLFEIVASTTALGQKRRTLFAIAKPAQLKKILMHLLNEDEFLSPYGIRALSRLHQKHPYVLNYQGHNYSVSYQPAESQTADFGGNSNWRGPIWVPMNFLLIKSMQRYYRYFGDEFKVECPTGSGQLMTLKEIAQELSRRLIDLYRRQPDGKRAVYAWYDKFQEDPHWRDLFLFHEYFHGDTGMGLGASQQTGWTALLALLIHEMHDKTYYDDLMTIVFF